MQIVESTETQEPAAEGAWPDRLATGLAYLVNPLVLPPLLFGLVLAHFGAPGAEIGWTVGVVLVFFALVPLGYVLWLVWQRAVPSLELDDPALRTRPLLLGLASGLLALALLAGNGTTAAALVLALAACQVLNTLLVLLVNLRWKISIHVIATAGFISVLLFVATTPWSGLSAVPPEALVLKPVALAGLLPVVPLLMWARVRTGAHTFGQVLGGALFGALLPFAELYALLRLGVFAGL